MPVISLATRHPLKDWDSIKDHLPDIDIENSKTFKFYPDEDPRRNENHIYTKKDPYTNQELVLQDREALYYSRMNVNGEPTTDIAVSYDTLKKGG